MEFKDNFIILIYYISLIFLMQEIRPFVKWAGWKRGLISQFIDYFPTKFDTYIEPFLWWGAVLIYILQFYKPKKVYAFDINPNLINCYQVIKYDVEKLISILFELQNEFHTAHSEKEKKEIYDKKKKQYNAIKLKKWETNIEKAALFIFLNKTCFNWLYRENRKGEFNVPCWKYNENPTICDSENLRDLSNLIQCVTFINWNYNLCNKFIDNKTFVYFDPPYRPLNKQWFTSYSKEDFNDDDQKKLARFFRRVHKKNAYLMLSNSNPKNTNPDDNFFEELYEWFNINLVFAKRNINSKWNWRWAISELLITNYKPFIKALIEWRINSWFSIEKAVRKVNIN